MKPEVSVVIINYHTFALTCDCIRSVVEKTKSIAYEIVLIDNGSNDEESMQFRSLFPDIIYVKAETNLGFSKGNNLGISHSSGEYILLLNSDTVLLNDAVFLAVSFFKKDPAVGVVSGQLVYPDGKPQAVAGRFPLLSRVLKDIFRITRSYDTSRRAEYFLGTEWDYNQSVEADWVWGAFFMFKRDDLKSFPGNKLHDEFFMYFEDVQWCFHFVRVLKRKVIYTPDPKAIHFIGGSSNIASEAEKYFTVILPNEHKWMKETRGGLYTSLHYFVKGLYYLTLRRPDDIRKGKRFMKFTFK